jgi:hypothetical protein
MTFRDDREAAHQRAEALQQELAETRAKLAAIEERRPSRGPAVAVALLIAGGLAGVTVGVLSIVASGARTRSARAAARREHTRQTEAYAARENRRIRRGLTELAARPQRPAAELEPPAAPAGVIVWRAVVDESADASVRVGSPCVLEGDFIGRASGAEASRLQVRCAGRTIYESPAGEAVRVGLREGPVYGGAAHRYLLNVTVAASEPSDRLTLTVSSMHHSAVVSRADDASARVSIYLRDVSDPREGPSLVANQRVAREPAFAADVERSLRVRSVQGRAPVAQGARCSFSVRAVWEYPETCRVALRCGTTWLYGAREAGYLTCEVRDGAAVGALDLNPSSQGGDPRLTWEGSRVTVGDFGESGAWELVLGP